MVCYIDDDRIYIGRGIVVSRKQMSQAIAKAVIQQTQENKQE